MEFLGRQIKFLRESSSIIHKLEEVYTTRPFILSSFFFFSQLLRAKYIPLKRHWSTISSRIVVDYTR